MNKKRSGGMTTIAVINFIFGGLGILVCLFGLIFANSLMSNPAMTLGAKGTQLGILMLVAALLSLPPAGAAIVSGIGILKLAAWGRTWTLVYAILGILATLIGLGLTSAIEELNPDAKSSNPVVSLVIGCIYPAILLWIINTRKWKDTFGNDTAEVAQQNNA